MATLPWFLRRAHELQEPRPLPRACGLNMRCVMTPRVTRWLAALGVLLAFGALGVGVGTLYQQIGQPWSGIPIFRTGDVGPRVLAARDVYPELQRAVPQTHIISIEAAIGCGKSTFLALLAKYFGNRIKIVYEPLDMWQNVDYIAPPPEEEAAKRSGSRKRQLKRTKHCSGS